MESIMAKSRNSLQGIKEQTLVEHTSDLIEVLDQIKEGIDLEKIKSGFVKYLRLICVLHDLGKMNGKFQEKIKLANEIDVLKSKEGDKQEIDKLWKRYKAIQDERHNLLSGAFLKVIFEGMAIEEDIKGILYKSIFFHHGSYDKYLGKSFAKIEKAVYEDIEKDVLLSNKYLKTDIEGFILDKLGFEMNFSQDGLIDYGFLKYFNEDFGEDDNKKKLYILFKGFLNLIDHIASSQEKGFTYYMPISPEKMDALLKSSIMRKCINNGQQVNEIKFFELQERISCMRDNNVLTTAFTGSGKTVADYRWYGKRKIFLVPNKISGESFYFDAVEILESEDNVGLLHGDISLYVENFRNSKRGEDILFTARDKTLVKNLAKPYIISTVDQILLAIFKYPGYEKIFANIYGSHITVDEVH